MTPIPVLPGNPVPKNSAQEHWLRNRLAALCGLNHDRLISPAWHPTKFQLTLYRFPGSQPVSFSSKDLERLEHEE